MRFRVIDVRGGEKVVDAGIERQECVTLAPVPGDAGNEEWGGKTPNASLVLNLRGDAVRRYPAGTVVDVTLTPIPATPPTPA